MGNVSDGKKQPAPTASEFGTGDCATDVGRELMEGAIEAAFEARATELMRSMFDHGTSPDECLAGAQQLLDRLAVAVNWCASAAPKPVGAGGVMPLTDVPDGRKTVRVPGSLAEVAVVVQREQFRALCIAFLYEALPGRLTLESLVRSIAYSWGGVKDAEVRRQLDYLESKGLVRMTKQTGGCFFKLTVEGVDEAERMNGASQ